MLGNLFNLFNEFCGVNFNDKRLTKQLCKFVDKAKDSPKKSIFGAMGGRNKAKNVYRLLENDKFDFEEVTNAHKQKTIDRIIASGTDVILNVQDTSGLNYSNHKKTKGLGTFDKDTKGINIHNSLAILPNGLTLGLLHQTYISRPEETKRKSKREKDSLPIEDKESVRWLNHVEKNRIDIPDNIRKIHVCDREGDIYELFNKIIELKDTFVIRVFHDRMDDENKKIITNLKKQELQGFVKVRIPRDSRNNIPERDATLDITFKDYEIKKPKNLVTTKKLPKSINAIFVHVKERLVEGAKHDPIEWFLVTNEEVNNIEDAYRIVEYYIERWKVELFHYTLKSGCNIEKKQERTIEKQKILIYLYSVIAIRIMMMTFLARTNPDLPCDVLFEQEEWELLYMATNNIKKK